MRILMGLRAGISCWRGKGKESQGVGGGVGGPRLVWLMDSK